MKQLFFHQLLHNAKRYNRRFEINIFMMKRMKKVFPINIVGDKKLFLHLQVNTKINNSFAIKNDKISQFENFDRASHLKKKKISSQRVNTS